jgi:hypothetical protein
MLSACANDQYTMANGRPIVDQDKYKDDLFDCKMAAIHEWQDPGLTPAAYLPGIVGGAIGGIIMGETSDLPNANGERPSDIDKHVAICMKKKGYLGTSS